MNEITQNQDYKNWLIALKANIKSSQIKAALAVNTQLIQLYWDLGKQIVEKQENTQWGSGFIDQLSKDLKEEFPTMGGFSKYNLYHIRNFYAFYFKQFSIVEQVALQLESDGSKVTKQVVSQLENIDGQDITKSQQVVGELKNDSNLIWQQAVAKLENQLFMIPWGHHILIIQKIKNTSEAIFYVQQTIENNWSRAVLEYQIETNLYQRQGKAITNFKSTLPQPDSDLANALCRA